MSERRTSSLPVPHRGALLFRTPLLVYCHVSINNLFLESISEKEYPDVGKSTTPPDPAVSTGMINKRTYLAIRVHIDLCNIPSILTFTLTLPSYPVLSLSSPFEQDQAADKRALAEVDGLQVLLSEAVTILLIFHQLSRPLY